MVIYLNLTNGIEGLKNWKDVKFIRIQSTACEQKRWDFLLQELDYNFLLDIALGEKVVVIDCGASKDAPRAMYQGLEFVKYVLNKHWLGKDYTPFVKNYGCSHYFGECYSKLSKRTLKKLDYFKKFIMTDEIYLETYTWATDKDGDYAYYKELLKRYKMGEW